MLVFDIHAERLRSGADAIGVLGQKDFTSREPGVSASSFNAPGHLAYDPVTDRLFVVDNRNHRVLAFDAPGSGAEASFVIGQPDFATHERKLTAEGLAFPNGIAYDRVRQHLYVADQGNDRVLAYDVADATPGMGAFAVLGQKDFETKSSQRVRDVSAQDQLYDPRGIDFDSDNARLWVTDSHWARLLVFDFPLARREVEVAANGAYKLSSLDPVLALGTPERRVGYGIAGDSDGTDAITLRTSTAPIVNELTEQQSRMLISQTATRAPRIARNHVAFLSARSTVWLMNPGSAEAHLQLTVHGDDGPTTSLRVLEGGRVETLDESGTGTLVVESDEPVAVVAWSHLTNRHAEDVITALPVVSESTSAQTVPNVVLGGGYATDIVLLNPGDGEIRGEVILFDADGQEFVKRILKQGLLI